MSSMTKPLLEGVDFLAQGTLYTDIIESQIKTDHQVSPQRGWSARRHATRVGIEPSTPLQGRSTCLWGQRWGMPDSLVWRQPFPGPGLACLRSAKSPKKNSKSSVNQMPKRLPTMA